MSRRRFMRPRRTSKHGRWTADHAQHSKNHMREEDAAGKLFETGTNMKFKYENNTYHFDLQGINFSPDSLLLLLVCRLVRLARAIVNERNFRSR